MVGENKKFITNRLIGYLSPTDPHKDRFAWSGTYFNTCKAIEDAGYQVDWIPSYDTIYLCIFLSRNWDS